MTKIPKEDSKKKTEIVSKCTLKRVGKDKKKKLSGNEWLCHMCRSLNDGTDYCASCFIFRHSHALNYEAIRKNRIVKKKEWSDFDTSI